MIVERIRGVTRFLEIALAEGLAVNDQDAIGRQIIEIGLERRRIHRDQNVRLVAGGEDLAAGKIELKAADASQSTGRSADFRRKIRQCGDIVAGHRGFGRELHAGQLHAVTGITGETDYDAVAAFPAFTGCRRRRDLRNQRRFRPPQVVEPCSIYHSLIV